MNQTYFEITRQYRTLRKTIGEFEARKEAIRGFYRDRLPKSLVFLGCGSSYDLAQSAESIARTQFGIPAMSVPAGDAMVNFQSYRRAFEGAMAVAISRSGSTTEMLRAVDAMKAELHLPVAAITCAEGSKLSEKADLCVDLPWAFDQSVCQTGTVSNLYAAAALFLAAAAGGDQLFGEMKAAAESGEDFIRKQEPALKTIADGNWNKAVVLADGDIAGLASEGALAFKEICCTVSNFYHVLDVRHGPMVLVDKNTLVIAALTAENPRYQLDLIEDLAKKGPTLVVCTDDSYADIQAASLHVRHAALGGVARGLPLLNVAQLIAYHKALKRGLNPGEPQGLTAWIKLA